MMITISINPVAFHIGTYEVRWYGILIALAVVALILWVWRQLEGKWAELPSRPDPIVIVFAILSGIVVSKALHVIDNIVVAKFHPELVLAGKVIDYTQHPGQIFSGGGLSIYGAVIGTSLFFLIYSKVRHYPFGFFADLAAPGIILAQAIGRVGCTINGCCYGKVCEVAPSWLPWSIVYTHPNSYAPLGVPLIPTQPYEIIFCLIVFAILLRLRRRLKPDGTLFLIYLTAYAAWRVGIDFLRVGTPFFFSLHQAQFISIIVLAVTIPILALRMWRSRQQAKIGVEKVDG
jgi:phosphatidylglycerol:prolipoprotein diacylglycerol transferase